jgi:hypothetical protein
MDFQAEARFLRKLIAVCDWLDCERLQQALDELEGETDD